MSWPSGNMFVSGGCRIVWEDWCGGARLSAVVWMCGGDSLLPLVQRLLLLAPLRRRCQNFECNLPTSHSILQTLHAPLDFFARGERGSENRGSSIENRSLPHKSRIGSMRVIIIIQKNDQNKRNNIKNLTLRVPHMFYR